MRPNVCNAGPGDESRRTDVDSSDLSKAMSGGRDSDRVLQYGCKVKRGRTFSMDTGLILGLLPFAEATVRTE